VSATNLRAVLAADPELGAGNVLLRLAEHGADMDLPRVTFDTGFDTIPAWTPLSLRTLTERVAARAECLAYIDETWTDMRPASLRRWMRDHERAGAD
jgi:hypothetical protein